LFKEFEQFFSMGGEPGAKTRGSSSTSTGKAKGKDINVLNSYVILNPLNI
jgi:hypothetical protein